MTTLILNNQFKQFDLNGEPLASGKVYTYAVGTTTPKTTYQDEAKIATHTNPIILDAYGEETIWIDGDTKFVVKDSDDVEIRTYPTFEDEAPSEEFPVVSSPLGAIYRSTTTDTGYIKIQLPMSEWPNTKMMFDVMVYTDDNDDGFKLTLSGYANSNISAWELTTALTNGIYDQTVQFGNDGTYPCIYIGAVDSEWVKPQVSVVNFMAGQFSYDWDTWNNGWDVSVTTSLGTITKTETARAVNIAITTEINDAVDAKIGWDVWQNPVFNTNWSDYGFGWAPVRYRKSKDGSMLQISGVGQCVTTPTALVFTLPSGYRPTADHRFALSEGLTSKLIDVASDGTVATNITTTGVQVGIELIVPLD